MFEPSITYVAGGLAESLKEVVVSTYHIRLCTDIAYRVYSIKRRGVYYIFRDSSAAFFRGRCLLEIQFISCKQ